MNKLLVIGLDGATLDLIEPWAFSGKLPNLKKLMENGAYGRLESVLPVLSSAAWPSFMTGMNPGKHGFYDFVKRAPDGYQLRPINRNQMRGASLWRILSDAGKRCISINVPMTYPPEPINGVMVTGLGTPNYQTFTYPEEYTRNLNKRGYRVNREIVFREGQENIYIEETHKITDQLTETTLWLMENEWDFCMVVYRDPDEMAHFFWHHMDSTHPMHPSDSPYEDAILEYYQKIDHEIGVLLDAAGENTNLMIMSDHGTGAFYKDVLLNEWLRQNGWLSTKEQSSNKLLSHENFARLGITRENISNTLRSLRLNRVEYWIKKILGDRIEFYPGLHPPNFPMLSIGTKQKPIALATTVKFTSTSKIGNPKE